MRAFGAEVELIPSPEGITPDLIPAMMRRAAEIAAETGAFATDQFNNTDMVDGYRAARRGAAGRSCRDRDRRASAPTSARRGASSADPALRAALPTLHRVVGRAGRVGGALRRPARHAPHRGRRHRAAPAAAATRPTSTR